MSTTVPYLGSKISLVSRSEIRYEGILYTIDQKESTVALAKVRSFGTEDRPTDRPVAPRDEVYEYIIFRGPDIKDIRVCHPPKPQPTLEGGLPNDPAIIQHSAVGNLHLNLGQISSVGHREAAKANRGFDLRGGTNRSSPRHPSGESLVMDLFCDGIQSSPGRGLRSFRMHQGNQRRGAPQGRRQIFVSRGQTNPYPRSGGRSRGGSNGYLGRRGGSGGFANARSDSQPGRPTTKREKLKFSDDYDFERANEQFQEFLTSFEKANLGKDAVAGETEADEQGEDGKATISISDKENQPFYDKTKSFFDTISCEASERTKGKSARPDWKAEKKLNKETFGETVPGQGRHRGFNNRGYARTNDYNPRRGGDGNYSQNYPHRYNQRSDFRQGYSNPVAFNSRFSRENATYQTNYRAHTQWNGSRRGQTSGHWVGVY